VPTEHSFSDKKNPYSHWLDDFQCTSLQELYSKLENIGKSKMGLDKLSYPLSALEQPSHDMGVISDITSFIVKCLMFYKDTDAEAEIIQLVKYLKKTPPRVTYKNPELAANLTRLERNIGLHIFAHGIDLPGCKDNTLGSGYFSNFFIDIFFGNYTEFIEHIDSLSKSQLRKTLKRREGYCQFSPVFAPILGLKMVNLESILYIASSIKQKIRDMYHGHNENKHFEILEKLLELGADANAHDIYGLTPLHYAVKEHNDPCITVLLKYGADPNAVSLTDHKPLSLLMPFKTKEEVSLVRMRRVALLIDHNAKPLDKYEANRFRSGAESFGQLAFAVKVREAFPRDKNECEKCEKPSWNRCKACGLTFYCSPACQKQDWKFHKITCRKNLKVKK
jgi:hypothetical protein